MTNNRYSIRTLLCLTVLLNIGVTSMKPEPIKWRTRTILFNADSLVIKAEKRLFAPSSNITRVHSDPGWNTYTTLEVTWFEYDIEMRLNIYFTSDGKKWWANEIRTYNGKLNGNWIYYKGKFFQQKLGKPFKGHLTLNNKNTGASLRIRNLQLETFFLKSKLTF